MSRNDNDGKKKNTRVQKATEISKIQSIVICRMITSVNKLYPYKWVLKTNLVAPYMYVLLPESLQPRWAV